LLVAAPALAGVIEAAMKQLAQRPRPLTAPLTGEGGYGFPSGHVAGFTALVVIAVCLIGFRTRWRFISAAIASIAIVTVALARLAVGAHYLTDVMGGVLVGSMVAFALVAITPAIAAIAGRLPLIGPWFETRPLNS
jgi:undecaprenyl-diphosphatase